MKSDPIIVFGAGGHAKVVIDIMEARGNYAILLGLIDVNCTKGDTFYNKKVLGTDDDLHNILRSNPGVKGIVAVGDNQLRQKVVNRILSEKPNFEFISAIHPSANISTSVTLNEGTVIMPGVSINADTVIGKHCIINTNSSIDHDCVIGNYVSISPNCVLAGGVTIEDGAMLGVGAAVIPGKKIYQNAVVGAGAVVVNNIPPDSCVVGRPAKPVKQDG